MDTSKSNAQGAITLTDEAACKLKQLAKNAEHSHWGLKFADEVSVCGQGYNYIIDLVPAAGEQDETIWFQDIPIFVRKESLPRLQGSVIEWHEEEAFSGQSGLYKKCFHVKNPNAKGECPCTCGIGFGL